MVAMPTCPGNRNPLWCIESSGCKPNDSHRTPFDLSDRLGRVKAPALIAVGSDDCFCSPFQAKRLHLWLPNSKLLLIENAGHFPWMEQPEVFFEDVPAFLKSPSGSNRQHADAKP